MIKEALLMIGTATSAAVLIPYLVRRYSNETIDRDWLANELDVDYLHQDNQTVMLKTGQFVRFYAIKGLSYETMNFDREVSLAKQRSAFLHQNFKFGVNLRLFGVKRIKDISFPATWPSPALQEIGEQEYSNHKEAYSLYWYACISAPTYSALEKAHKSILATYAEYEARPVIAADEPFQSCELCSILNYLISGHLRFDVPRMSRNLSATLPGSDIHFSMDGLAHTFTPRARCHRIITVRSWPESVSGFVISNILALEGELEVMQIAVPVRSEKALGAYTRKINEQRSNIFGNNQVIDELNQAKDDLSNNSKTFFDTQFQVLISGTTPEEVERLISEIEVLLNQERIVYTIETSGAAVCWFNRVPDRSTLLKPLRLCNNNLAALWPLQYSPEGLFKSPFGDRPIRQFKTPTGQSYAFQFHVSERPQSAGNYVVIAPTGTGKSTLILHLLGGLTKFGDLRNYVFDSKNGAQFMIEVLGGLYQDFSSLSLNPLDMDLTRKENQHRAHLILRAMAGTAYTPDIDKEIQSVVEMAKLVEWPDRTLNNIYDTAFKPRSDLKKAFAKWVVDTKGTTGQYHHIFNSPRDSLSSVLDKSYLVGINMNEALEDAVLGPALIAHISSAISEAAKQNRNGFSIFVDEAANLLRNSGFRSVVLEMFREYRKLNGLVGLAFQDPEALLKFEGHEGIIKNCQTLLFMPNSQATTESLEPFNLTQDQISFIRGEHQLSGGRQVLVVKRDLASGFDESAIIDVDLSALGPALRFYRAGTSANADLAALKEQWGDKWLSHA